jgi:Cu/Zn superoxide dismutase
MKHALLLVAVLFGCGGGSKNTTPPITPTPEPAPEVVATPTPPPPAPEPAPPPPPPPPKQFAAQVELAPIKGQKMKAVVVKFSQQEGKSAVAMSDSAIEGLKPGKYHLVVHEAGDCGPNGTKAGKVWETTAANAIVVEVTKASPTAKIESTDLAIALDGDQSIVGKTLVLHDDKAGKPGKIQACGAIAKLDDAGGSPPGGAGAK